MKVIFNSWVVQKPVGAQIWLSGPTLPSLGLVCSPHGVREVLLHLAPRFPLWSHFSLLSASHFARSCSMLFPASGLCLCCFLGLVCFSLLKFCTRPIPVHLVYSAQGPFPLGRVLHSLPHLLANLMCPSEFPQCPVLVPIISHHMAAQLFVVISVSS